MFFCRTCIKPCRVDIDVGIYFAGADAKPYGKEIPR
jgi:hypothetical protein